MGAVSRRRKTSAGVARVDAGRVLVEFMGLDAVSVSGDWGSFGDSPRCVSVGCPGLAGMTAGQGKSGMRCRQ